jgi:hypothetical protein
MADKKGSWLESMFAGMTGLFDAFGQYTTGQGGAQDALSRALTSTFNARQSRIDTAEAARIGEQERRQFIGTQGVARAKQGVAAGGSASLVIDEADRAFAMDVLALKHRETLNQIERAGEVDASLRAAKTSTKLGRIGAFGSLLKASGHFAEARRLRIGG